MTYLIVFAVYLAILFIIAWMSRRSMGVPTLTLAAGALMSSLWTGSLTPIVAQSGIVTTQPPLTSIVAIVLTLLPALIVMLRSRKMSSKQHGLIGSLIFAVLAASLTYGAFSNAVVLDEQSKQYTVQYVSYHNTIITTCIVLALAEVLLYKKPADHHDEKHKK